MKKLNKTMVSVLLKSVNQGYQTCCCSGLPLALKINLQHTNRVRHSPNIMVLLGQIKMNLGGKVSKETVVLHASVGVLQDSLVLSTGSGMTEEQLLNVQFD